MFQKGLSVVDWRVLVVLVWRVRAADHVWSKTGAVRTSLYLHLLEMGEDCSDERRRLRGRRQARGTATKNDPFIARTPTADGQMSAVRAARQGQCCDGVLS